MVLECVLLCKTTRAGWCQTFSPPSCKRYHDYIGVVGRMAEETETGATGGCVAGGGAGLTTGGAGHAAGARPLVLPETFDGTGSWSDWCFHFENGWDGAQN